MLSPLQIEAVSGEIDAVGSVTTLTVADAVAEHEFASVAVTVYVVPVAGVTVMLGVTCELLHV